MKLPITLLALGAVITIAAGSAQAQPLTVPPAGFHHATFAGPAHPKPAAKPKPAVLAKRFERKGTLAQKAWAQSFKGERKQLHAGVSAGTLTKKAANKDLHAWVKTNKPPRKP